MDPHYDLIIIGGGCVGMAMAYTARKEGKRCVLLEKEKIGDPNRYWSSSFSARQTRVQYTEAYLSNYVLLSNRYWEEIEQEAKTIDFEEKKFYHKEGGLWFGDRNITSSEGNIFESNIVLNEIGIPKLYMESLDPDQPTFFKNFKMRELHESKDWAALYERNGGSIDMEASYKYFYHAATKSKKLCSTDEVRVIDECQIDSYKKEGIGAHSFSYRKGGCSHQVKGSKIFIATGIQTPFFIENIMKAGTVLKQEAAIYDYMASYFQIKKGMESMFDSSALPTWIQFLPDDFNIGYGFPFHEWDNPVSSKKCIKIGTMKGIKKYDKGKGTENKNENQEVKEKDLIDAAREYVKKYMKNLIEEPTANYICPIVFYEGRETVLDFLNRTDKDIVVQSGGWVGKYYPKLASTAYKMLFSLQSLEKPKDRDKEFIQKQCCLDAKVEREFLNRTSFPIRKRVVDQIENVPIQETDFDSVVVGGGVSGLYTTYRLLNSDKTMNEKTALFQMGKRIGGRLWSVKFKGSNTPMQLGGMRYIQEIHQLLSHYIQHLHIPSTDFKMSGNPAQSYMLQAYLRNDRYRQKEWTDLQKEGQKLHTSYRLDDKIIGMTATQIVGYSAYMIMTAKYNRHAVEALNDFRNDSSYFSERVKQIITDSVSEYEFKLNMEDWNVIKPLLRFQSKKRKHGQENSQEKGELILKYGFQNVIENQFSHEAYLFVSDQNGYYSSTANINYIEQVMGYLLDFGDVNYKTLVGGYDMICYNLANHILNGDRSISKKGGIYLQKELVGIEKQNQKYKLTFKDHLENQNIHITCKKLILAMPVHSIENLYTKIDLLQKPITNYQPTKGLERDELHPLNPKNPENLKEMMKSVRSMPAMKIIVNFHTNWWDIGHKKGKQFDQFKTIDQMRGVSVTDLPMRQCLYFGTANDNFLLASYNDLTTVDFWNALQHGFEDFIPSEKEEKCVKTRKQKYKQCSNRDNTFRMDHNHTENINKASVEVVREVCRELSLLHGRRVRPCQVKEAMIQNWNNEPFGGGYHQWQYGYDVPAIMKSIRKPWKEEEIMIVGASFSNMAGWVQGALQTSERMLMEYYGIAPTNKDIYLGY